MSMVSSFSTCLIDGLSFPLKAPFQKEIEYDVDVDEDNTVTRHETHHTHVLELESRHNWRHVYYINIICVSVLSLH